MGGNTELDDDFDPTTVPNDWQWICSKVEFYLAAYIEDLDAGFVSDLREEYREGFHQRRREIIANPEQTL